MVRVWRILAAVVLILLTVPLSCSGGDIDPDVTTYTTVEERNSQIGSEGGQIELEDGSSVTIPQDGLDKTVRVTFSRKSAFGELPQSMNEDPDSQLISDFYFLQVDEVLNHVGESVLAFPYDSSAPTNQVRVIEVFNIEDETHVRFVHALVDETSQRVIIPHAELLPTRTAIEEYEEEWPPGGYCGFPGARISIGYAAIWDTYEGNPVLLGAGIQASSQGAPRVCVTRWGRITCSGERAEVSVARLYGTSDDMVDYAFRTLEYVDSIQLAYSDAGFETHETVKVHITPLSVKEGAALVGSGRVFIKRGFDAVRGGKLNYLINHEIVHTMQGALQPPWWRESSAEWIAYYFEPDEDARQQIRESTVSFIHSSPDNPFVKAFPPLNPLSARNYDYSVLIDYAIDAADLSPGDVIGFMNDNSVPTDQLRQVYRHRPDGFARHLIEAGPLLMLAQTTGAAHEFDGSSSGSVEVSFEVDPLTTPIRCYWASIGTGPVTIKVSVVESSNDGGVVVGNVDETFLGVVSADLTVLHAEQVYGICLLPFAKGYQDVQLKLLLEWEPWGPGQVTLTVSSTAGGAVTAPGEGIFNYDPGTMVELEAGAEEGYRFVNWTGDVGKVGDVNAAVTTITMEGNYSITANFAEEGEEEPVEPADITRIVAGYYHTVGLRPNGHAIATGRNNSGQCDVDAWREIVQVAAYGHTVGLKSDRTVVATGSDFWGRLNVGDWTDIVQVAAGSAHTVGLKSDGTVVAVGRGAYGETISGWTDIIQVDAGGDGSYGHAVGLRVDGTVVGVAWLASGLPFAGVEEWTDIVQVSTARAHTVGLRSDGTVVAVGSNSYGRCDVGGWTGVVQVATAEFLTVGLKADGTVIAVGTSSNNCRDVHNWTDIVQVAAGGSTMGSHVVGLKSDGTVIAVGYNSYGQCDVDDWNLG